MAEVVDRPAAAVERSLRSPEVRETRERLIDAISAHGPITARQLAERFGLTSAAVRRHLASLEADEVIAEHEMPVRNRGRGRPSKAFVLSKAAHERLPGGYDELAVLAIEGLARAGGDAAVERLADQRVADWEGRLARSSCWPSSSRTGGTPPRCAPSASPCPHRGLGRVRSCQRSCATATARCSTSPRTIRSLARPRPSSSPASSEPPSSAWPPWRRAHTLARLTFRSPREGHHDERTRKAHPGRDHRLHGPLRLWMA